MKFTELPLPGAYRIDLERRGDDRGFFARYFCRREYAALGLDADIVQINNSFSRQTGTLRGMHYQLPPHAETKVVRVLAGRIFDAIIDLRPKSASFGRWFGIELDADARAMLYVPKGFAHGFLTLEPDTEVLYLVSGFYAPQHERCVRWDDPKFAIAWPAEPQLLSDKDRAQGDFDTGHHLAGMEDLTVP
jgi:dTDP-4-dehydrorhamnose 3,5-epimerase